MRIKVFKFKSMSSWSDYDNEIIKNILETFTEWEDVSVEEFCKLENWIRLHHEYCLITPDYENNSPISVKSILIEIDKEDALREKARVEYEEKHRAAIAKREKTKKENELKKLEKLKAKVAALEQYKNSK